MIADTAFDSKDPQKHSKPFKPSRCTKASFYSLKADLIFQQLVVFLMKISMKLVCQYMVFFFKFLFISNNLHPLQVENCNSNSRLAVDEDDYGKFRLERVKDTHRSAVSDPHTCIR